MKKVYPTESGEKETNLFKYEEGILEIAKTGDYNKYEMVDYYEELLNTLKLSNNVADRTVKKKNDIIESQSQDIEVLNQKLSLIKTRAVLAGIGVIVGFTTAYILS